MSDDGRPSAESPPEGRGCVYVSLVLVILALLVFVVTAWISAPGTPPAGDAVGAGPATAPAP